MLSTFDFELVLLMIRTLLAALLLIFSVALVLPWLVLWSLIVGSPDLMYGLAMKVTRFLTRLVGIRVHIQGLENIPPGPCVFVSNHVSNVDAAVLIPAIPRRVGILVKQELFRIPIFSTAMRLAQFIPVDRRDKESTSASVPLAVSNLKKGLSYVLFSEGTRSPDGRLRSFKRGAFTMAIDAGVPVVPVSIVGTQRLLGKSESTIHPGEATIRFGPAVDGSAYTMETRSELLALVESLVAAGLPPDQQPRRSDT